MKHSLQTLVCMLSLALALSACAGQKTSVYAPIIPPPTYKTDPALLLGQTPSANATTTEYQEAGGEEQPAE